MVVAIFDMHISDDKIVWVMNEFVIVIYYLLGYQSNKKEPI